MKEKYEKHHLNYELIIEKYPDLNEYESIVNTFFEDEFFKEMKGMLENEDYALAKDAAKGLYLLAQDLCLYPLYMALVEIYEDIDEDTLDQVMIHYEEMMQIYEDLRKCFHV